MLGENVPFFCEFSQVNPIIGSKGRRHQRKREQTELDCSHSHTRDFLERTERKLKQKKNVSEMTKFIT